MVRKTLRGKDARLAKIVDAIRRPQLLKAQYGQMISVVAQSSFPTSVYVTTEVFDGASAPDDADKNEIITVTLNSARHLASLADVAWKNNVTTSQAAPVFNSTTFNTDIGMRILINSSVKYSVRNQSTDIVRVRAYYCRARQDLNIKNFSSGTTNPTSIYNLYMQLARGFAINGLDAGNFTATSNSAMVNRKYTPYNSHLFTSNWKIYKSKLMTLSPGRLVTLGIKQRRFCYRPSKYFELNGTGGAVSWRTSQLVYHHNRFEKFIMFQIDSSPAGYGAAQTNYSKLVGSTTPTVILDSEFKYKYSYMWSPINTTGVIEQSGHALQFAGANTIVNVEEGILGEEKDAV